MNTNKVFITDNAGALDEFKKIILETSGAIADAFENDKAYTGPEPFDLKKEIKVQFLPQNGIGFEKTLENGLKWPSSNKSSNTFPRRF